VRLPEAARDIKINLQTVLKPGTLNLAQVLGVALACAHATRCAPLLRALERVEGASDAVKGDAQAAAVLMAMNNVYYRSRHLLGGVTAEKSPRLRMQRMASAVNRGDFELCCLAVSALAGCPTCLFVAVVGRERAEACVNAAGLASTPAPTRSPNRRALGSARSRTPGRPASSPERAPASFVG